MTTASYLWWCPQNCSGPPWIGCVVSRHCDNIIRLAPGATYVMKAKLSGSQLMVNSWLSWVKASERPSELDISGLTLPSMKPTIVAHGCGVTGWWWMASAKLCKLALFSHSWENEFNFLSICGKMRLINATWPEETSVFCRPISIDKSAFLKKCKGFEEETVKARKSNRLMGKCGTTVRFFWPTFEWISR